MKDLLNELQALIGVSSNDGLDDFGQELKVQDKRIEKLQQEADELLRDVQSTKSLL